MLEVVSIANTGRSLYRIINTGMLELEVPVPVEDVKWINKGDKVITNAESGSGQWIGKVVRKADYVDRSTQSVSIFISVQNSSESPLFEGQYLTASFDGEISGNAMEIPRRAVFNNNEVFIVTDNTLRKAEINILKVNQQSMIFNGLEEGVSIIVEPLINVVEGTVVEIY